ncbi:hypothetical protein PLESTB_000761200 [Pleodorina starrii]|uniref:5-formyltetrahydrofolate cyclo-ligase n=1 Tax=Pleodorina starrii TaxID=330485 RepID=A0A9W6BJU5_9CHLO|nr:hypothetical protein PLESTB_000761200 [Pleodorina starrii]
MRAAVSSPLRCISSAPSALLRSVTRVIPSAVNLVSSAGTMPVELREQKQQARKAIKQQLRELTAEQMADESARIADHVLGLRAYRDAKTIGIYLHCAKLREVDTTRVLEDAMRQGKRCYVPVVEDSNSNMRFLHLDDLSCLRRVPPFDILEPTDTYPDGSPRQDVLGSRTPLDLLLMPGLGFDRSGRRLGRGGGGAV